MEHYYYSKKDLPRPTKKMRIRAQGTLCILCLASVLVPTVLLLGIYHSSFTADFRSSYPPDLQALNHPVLELCGNTEWRKDVYLDCFIRMGAFNAINMLQTCIRLAMDGGVGLIKPTFVTRKYSESLGAMHGPKRDVGYLLNEEFLWKALEESCPQLQVVERETLDSPYILSVGDPNRRFSPGQYKSYLNNITDHPSIPLPSSPIIFHQENVLLQWMVTQDPLPFQERYRNMFHFNTDIERIALHLLTKLPYYFFGIHLRVESDFITLNPEEQLLRMVLAKNTTWQPLVFLACGEEDKTRTFKKLAETMQIKVVDKWSLADEEHLEAMNELEFDQVGIVDYIILHHARYFFGIGVSSFSYSLAVSRHYYQHGNLELIGPPPENKQDEQTQLIFLNSIFYGAVW